MTFYKATALEKRLISQSKYGNEVLAQSIRLPDGTKTIEQCTDQEFDVYVYSVLRQLFESKGPMLKAYKQNFADLDWTHMLDRIYALNQLDALIEARKIALWGKRELDVRLFVE